MANGLKIFNSLVKTLDNKNWSYDKDEENLVISSGIKGDDFPVEFLMVVDDEREIVSFLSRLPFNFPEDKIIDGAIAICAINNRLINGTFDYNIENGKITFRMVSSYKGGISFNDEIVDYMILVSASTVDKYNDKLFMISKNMLSLQQFLEDLNKD